MVLINNKLLSLEKDIQSRDKLELLACLAVCLIFGYILFASHSMWKQIGSAILILSAIFIAYKLKSTQIRSKSDTVKCNHSMEQHLKLELKQVRSQKKMLRNIVWWYIAPIVVGLSFFTMGFESGVVIQIIYMCVVIILSAVVWQLNQRVVRSKFDPLIKEIEEAIQSLNDNP
jgi:Flp pilus assembly protein TadB